MTSERRGVTRRSEVEQGGVLGVGEGRCACFVCIPLLDSDSKQVRGEQEVERDEV